MSFFPRARGIPKQFSSGQPFNNTANQIHVFTVPDGKLWQIISFMGIRTDTSSAVIKKVDKDGTIIATLASFGSGSTPFGGPEAVTDFICVHFIAWEGEGIRFDYGAAQTSQTSRVVLDVIEFDLKELLEKQK